MDFIETYNNLDSRYETGISFEAKEFLNSNVDVSAYSVKLIEEELYIYIEYNGKSMKSFVFDFLSFISYSYMCLVHKEETVDSVYYYIYTKISENNIGVKIKLIFQK